MSTIFFILSKVAQFCIEPLNWVLVFILLSLLFFSLSKLYLVKRFLIFALISLLIIGYLPTSEVFLNALENASPKISLTHVVEKDIGGIIILGGAVRGGLIGSNRNEVSLESSAERVTKGFELMRYYPNLPFVYSGFSDQLMPDGVSEADAFKRLVIEQGLGEHSGYYENKSRNTYENAIFIKPIIEGVNAQDPSGKALKPWLLITSASHMYRSVRIFEKQGIEVIAVPVDYQTGGALSLLDWWEFNVTEGAKLWNRLSHEVFGLLAYWITGKL